MSVKFSSSAAAKRPWHIRLRDWWRVLMRVVYESDRRNLGLVAAGIAFYALVSIFPALAALIAFWGFFADPGIIQEQLNMAQRLLPEQAYGILEEQVADLISTNSSTLQLTSLLSILVAVWTARNAVAAMMRGLNSIYREEHRQSTLHRYGMAILLTVVLIVVAILAFAAVVILPAIFGHLNFPFAMEAAIAAVKWLVLLVIVLFGIGVVYRYGPNRRGPRLPWITPGAVLALLFWALGSLAFSVYLRNFGNYNEIYGSLGAVIILLLWFYISAYVVLMGAQLNAELELVTGHDTTIGQERPPGHRRAYVADNIVGTEGEVHRADEPVAASGRAAENDDTTEGTNPPSDR